MVTVEGIQKLKKTKILGEKKFLLQFKILNVFRILYCCYFVMETVLEYGAPEESELEVKSSSLTSSLVRVTLRSETQSVTKTLPKTMQLSRLTLLIKRLFNTGDVEHSLYYRSTQVTIFVCYWCA